MGGLGFVGVSVLGFRGFRVSGLLLWGLRMGFGFGVAWRFRLQGVRVSGWVSGLRLRVLLAYGDSRGSTVGSPLSLVLQNFVLVSRTRPVAWTVTC